MLCYTIQLVNNQNRFKDYVNTDMNLLTSKGLNSIDIQVCFWNVVRLGRDAIVFFTALFRDMFLTDILFMQTHPRLFPTT
jgi:hypothetical protein